MNGAERIAAERTRQIEVDGWSTKANVFLYPDGQLADAAACYALSNGRVLNLRVLWPWSLDCWDPTPENRVRELEKAGALIAAEIDRLLAEQELNQPSATQSK